MGSLGMTLNFKAPALESVEYSLIVITPRSTLTKSGSTC